ncbi:MAG: EAL domain-containing protein [Oscillospiraceae bacterium]|nr:EAL domain-containing protein [Oscillospiraceae bacterium]
MIQSKKLQRRRQVLVVEDQELNRDILGMILEDDYDVLFAENGAIAMEMIQANVQTLSIVLLDLMMPVMDGFEVLRRVKEDEEMRRIPIIVLTTEKSAELQALQMGAADFITKPYDMHEVILARVARIIELSEGRQLIRAAERDPLTNLYNRGFFLEYADQIRRYHPQWRMDAIVINIERFHSVNELNGRAFGNSVLRTLGSAIRDYLAGTDGIACRMEADQFCIYCLHCEDYHALLNYLQRTLNDLSIRVAIRLRMGVCPGDNDGSPAVLFDRARTACNMVRGSYKTHLMVYDEAIRRKELYSQRLLNDLRRAVEEKQFVVFYQPKYDIQCHPPRLNSAEALVRWKHPELGMIPPGDFIPLFEQNGLIHVVDEYVWETAAQQIAVWREKFGIMLPLSVNLSRTEVFDPELEKTLLRLISGNALKAKDLKLEVTESAYMDDAEQLVNVIQRLRDHGFEIEMDDFGSGYSSLNTISSLPIDVLKMDMKFIQNVDEDTRSFRLIELILDIAGYLGVPVVAEGVETAHQMNLLKAAGCDYVQGYYFSRPLPAEEFEKLIIKELEASKEKKS